MEVIGKMETFYLSPKTSRLLSRKTRVRVPEGALEIYMYTYFFVFKRNYEYCVLFFKWIGVIFYIEIEPWAQSLPSKLTHKALSTGYFIAEATPIQLSNSSPLFKTF